VTPEPEPSVVEWGSDRIRRLGHISLPWQSYSAWVLATAGAIAAFASLVSDWQVIPDPLAFGPGETTFGLGLVWVWGAGWALGAMVIAACTGLALLGPRLTRAGARAVGLATGGVLVPFLAAAAINLRRENLYTVGNLGQEIDLGLGVYLAFGSTVLFTAAAWLAPTAARMSPARLRRVAAAEPEAPEDRHAPPAPPDLTVEPTEPWTTPEHPDGGR
jgi:hypothetical protein